MLEPDARWSSTTTDYEVHEESKIHLNELTSTPIRGDVPSIPESPLSTQAPLNVDEDNGSPTKAGRPCLAGTQTKTQQQPEAGATTLGEINEVSIDSSGIGSMLSERTAEESISVLQNKQELLPLLEAEPINELETQPADLSYEEPGPISFYSAIRHLKADSAPVTATLHPSRFHNAALLDQLTHNTRVFHIPCTNQTSYGPDGPVNPGDTHFSNAGDQNVFSGLQKMVERLNSRVSGDHESIVSEGRLPTRQEDIHAQPRQFTPRPASSYRPGYVSERMPPPPPPQLNYSSNLSTSHSSNHLLEALNALLKGEARQDEPTAVRNMAQPNLANNFRPPVSQNTDTQPPLDVHQLATAMVRLCNDSNLRASVLSLLPNLGNMAPTTTNNDEISAGNNTNESPLTTLALVSLLQTALLGNRPVKSTQQLPTNNQQPRSQDSSSYWPPGIASTSAFDDYSMRSSLLARPTPQKSNYDLAEEIDRLTTPYQRLLTTYDEDIERAANVYRTSASALAQHSEATEIWSGELPPRSCNSMAFSRKVFLGGVPWDCTSDDLIAAFSRFGSLAVLWPQRDANGGGMSLQRHAPPKGYCYLVFENEANVAHLIANCNHDPSNKGDYYAISSNKFKTKDVQVIPWVISDSQFSKTPTLHPDTTETVFIGALHGMITAEALATIMDELFGNVIFAALDTDKHKYPIGSGRVKFSCEFSYMRAVTANFVDIRTNKFTKRIQIDPYLEDALCSDCRLGPGIYFCRAFECFKYFCPPCWHRVHARNELKTSHKPLRRTFKPINDRPWTHSMRQHTYAR